MADITRILADAAISIDAMLQKEPAAGETDQGHSECPDDLPAQTQRVWKEAMHRTSQHGGDRQGHE